MKLGALGFPIRAAKKGRSMKRNTLLVATLSTVLIVSASAFATDPAIATQPASLTVDLGKPASFTVVAHGATSLSYAWAHNGAAIPNATSATYPITSVQTTDQGIYTCTVADTAGTVTSDPATLLIQSVPPLVNYQGMLTDTGGNAVQPDGQYVLQFRIWGDRSSTDPSFRIWGRQSTVTVVGGKFNVILNDAMDPIAGETFAPNDIVHAFGDKERFLAITIKTVPPKSTVAPGDIAPRQQILSAPFAMQAQSAAHATLAQTAETATSISGRKIEDLLGIIGSSETAAHALTLKSADGGHITAGYVERKPWIKVPFHLSKKAQLLVTLHVGGFQTSGAFAVLTGFGLKIVKDTNTIYDTGIEYEVTGNKGDGLGRGNCFSDLIELDTGSYVLTVDVSGVDSASGADVKSGDVFLAAFPSL